MCTAIYLNKIQHYLGRNLDLDYDFEGKIVFVPRRYHLHFKNLKELDNHYAFMGMAVVINDSPLFADGFNEYGLSIAGLNFDGYAKFSPVNLFKNNIAPFELITYLLAKFKSVKEVMEFINDMNIVDMDFSRTIKAPKLHWIIGDKKCSITLECTKDGIRLYRNPFGVLTNNPEFSYHVENVRNFLNITNDNIESRFANNVDLRPISKGSGTFSLPGDYTSPSRFVKAAFLVNNFPDTYDENDALTTAFDILKNVSFVRGCVISTNGKYEITYYSCIMDLDNLVYYYTNHNNSRIMSISLIRNHLNGDSLKVIPQSKYQDIDFIA
jgi:choloylglycine hydrolase